MDEDVRPPSISVHETLRGSALGGDNDDMTGDDLWAEDDDDMRMGVLFMVIVVTVE